MNRELYVYKAAGELCSHLGLPVPEIRLQRGQLSTEPFRRTRNLGYCHYGNRLSALPSNDLPFIQINVLKHSNAKSLRSTVAHELTHYAFPKLHHGVDFERRIQGLLSGNLFFRGSMKTIGWNPTYTAKVREKVVMLDTDMPRKPTEDSEKIIKAQERIKTLDARIKRLTTLKMKWERRLRRFSK